MKAMLHIISSLDGYSMFILNDNKECIFFTHHAFKTYAHKAEELQSSSLENTKLLIEFAQKNGITSLGIIGRFRYYPLEVNIRLLNESGIDVTSIKDTTPMPFHGCRPQRRARVRK